jgi:hypothetical protein
MALNWGYQVQRWATQKEGPECFAPGKSLSDIDASGWTSLGVASFQGHTELVKFLIENRCDVDRDQAIYYHSGTPLILAAERGHENIVRLLVHAGAEIDKKGGYWSQTALWYAIKNNHAGVVAYLLEHGADRRVVQDAVRRSEALEPDVFALLVSIEPSIATSAPLSMTQTQILRL